ncbi:MAG: hypothetical protein ACOYWZ_06530 [Bacillota bacterium]
MNDSINEIINCFQNELERTNIEDFYIIRYERSGRLLLAGSFDFSYYHDVEIIFYDVSFICCPGSTFTVNKLRLATNSEIEEVSRFMDGYEKDGFVICLEDSIFNSKYFIAAYELKYKFQKVHYYLNGKLIEGEIISDWAKENFK